MKIYLNVEDEGLKFVHFTYVHILRIDSKYIYLIFRTTQKEKQECEKTEAIQKTMPAAPSSIPSILSIPVTLTVSMPVSSPQSTPRAASGGPVPSFETPHSTKHIAYPTTPAGPASTVGSLDSKLDVFRLSNSSGLTPEVNCMTVTRIGRGRPCKIPCPPTYEDFPTESTEDDKKKWKNHKKTEEWRYKKIMSADTDEYREREKECVSWYVSDKRQDLIDAACGESSMYKHIREEDMTPESKAKEKSRKR